MEAFIFDMDGIIVDSEPVHSRTKLETLRHFGLDFAPERLERYMGRTSRALFADALREQGREGLDPEELVRYKHQLYLNILQDGSSLQPVAGTLEVIAGLQAAGMPLAVASSAGRSIIEAVLDFFGIRTAFAVVVSGTELPHGKPDPGVYLLAARQLGAAPSACAVLEDAAAGVAAAKAAGMYCIAYRNPASGQQNLSAADKIIGKISWKKISECLKNR